MNAPAGRRADCTRRRRPPNWRAGCARDRGRGAVRRRLARPLRHRRVDLPDHAGGRVRARHATSDVATAMAIARELSVPVLPRGGGTSQCGQTTGAALVIDTSKHLRQVLDVDAQAMTAEVEPGLVLDHLNAALKPHGLWFPVDVSTSAQATLGGMAGNNSCGSRSIAYGNMVHNVAGIDAWLADGTAADVRPGGGAGRARARHRRLRARPGRAAARRDRGALAQGAAPRGRLQPRHLPPAERAALHRTTAASTWRTCWSAAEGTLAFTRSLTLQLSPLPRAKVLGVVNFAELPRGDGRGAAHRQAGPERGRTGRPHDDRAGARQPGVPADDRDAR